MAKPNSTDFFVDRTKSAVKLKLLLSLPLINQNQKYATLIEKYKKENIFNLFSILLIVSHSKFHVLFLIVRGAFIKDFPPTYFQWAERIESWHKY